MFKRVTIAAMGTVIVASLFLLIRCSARQETASGGLVGEVVDSVASTVVESLIHASVSPEGAVSVAGHPVASEAEEVPGRLVAQVQDIAIVGPKLYAAFDGGLAVYDFISKTSAIIRVDDKLGAVAVHDGEVYTGGTYLYLLNDTSLEKLDEEYAGAITTMFGYDYRLMIGTECGLYTRSAYGREMLMDDVTVTALVSDEGGLWVGTGGQGLYRWDGEKFRKRYLLRDPHLFDTVFALDFQHRHLYLGSSNGLHIFDGGRWLTRTVADGLPSNSVQTIDASQWVVYVGTEAGVVSYFDEVFLPVERLGDKDVNKVRMRGSRVVVATDYEGVLMKTRVALKTLVPPVPDQNIDILTLLP